MPPLMLQGPLHLPAQQCSLATPCPSPCRPHTTATPSIPSTAQFLPERPWAGPWRVLPGPCSLILPGQGDNVSPALGLVLLVLHSTVPSSPFPLLPYSWVLKAKKKFKKKN